MPYIKSPGVFRCPDNTTSVSADTNWYANLHTPPAYALDYGFADPGIHSHNDTVTLADLAPYRLSQIDDTAKIVLLSDAVMFWNQTLCEPDPDKSTGKGSFYFAQGDPTSPYPFVNLLGQPIHHGGMNFVYADGHAKMGRVAAIKPTGSDPYIVSGYYPTGRALSDDCVP
jgi:prepilin-type processing-associated H-X9-DG protein